MNKLSVNALRVLSIDEINKANSGHPGMVLGVAPVAYTLWVNHLNISPKFKDHFNRDRFILASGHASSMLYALLHLSGYNVTLDDLKNFRQLGSKTPGHPEYRHTEGVDATSGPLGQGIAMGLGMAIAEDHLAARFNNDEFKLIDHYTYVICGDGDLQEGVTQEAMSLAGRLGTKKLIVLYDSNDNQLDGPVSLANTEDTKKKYEAMHWDYQLVKDVEDLSLIDRAIKKAKKSDKPSIIEFKTKMGYASPLEGSSACHGAPLGLDNTKVLKDNLNYHNEPFIVDEEVYEDFRKAMAKNARKLSKWNRLFKEYQKRYPELGAELKSIIKNEYSVPFDVFSELEVKKESSRVSGGNAIKVISKHINSFIGGSADLTKSTFAKGLDGNYDQENPLGRNINFGVREHAMGAVINGLTLHHLRAFSGGFFVFSDYMKPAIRMASLMSIPSIFIFTHDSIAVGEDGPTHEPIEQLAGLRSIPGLKVYRPMDAFETNVAFKLAIESKNGPSAIVLSRQNLNPYTHSFNDVVRGGYLIKKFNNPDALIIASGSEVDLALNTSALLEEEGYKVNVASFMSLELFDSQDEKYKASVLNVSRDKILALEMAHPMPWYKYTSNVCGINTFGASGEASVVIKHFGFTKEEIANTLRKEVLDAKKD